MTGRCAPDSLVYARVRLLGIAVALLLLSVGHLYARVEAQSGTPTSGVGGKLSLGTPSLSGGHVTFSINTTAAQDAYDGDNLHVTMDPNLLGFGSADASTSVYTSVGTPTCFSSTAPPQSGGGFVTNCSLSSGSLTSAGLLRNVTLDTRSGSGCAVLHLETLNAPDFGGTTYGSYTIRQTQPEANTYGADVSVDLSNGMTGCLVASSVGGIAMAPQLDALPQGRRRAASTAALGVGALLFVLIATGLLVRRFSGSRS